MTTFLNDIQLYYLGMIIYDYIKLVGGDQIRLQYILKVYYLLLLTVWAS